MGLYDDKPEPQKETTTNSDESTNVAMAMEFPFRLLEWGIDAESNIVYLSDEITEHTLPELVQKFRTVLRFNDPEEGKKPINLLINCMGGDLISTLGIIDYINTLDRPVNTICRGGAMSAAAVILTCGTGKRYMSPNSTVMFHEGSMMEMGRVTDIKNSVKWSEILLEKVYGLLADKTTEDVEFWKKTLQADTYLSAEECIKLGVIDEII
jgi:ATP-dependent Clp protease protease subunit